MHVSRQPIELGNNRRGLAFAAERQSFLQYRTTLESIGALASLDFDKLGDQFVPATIEPGFNGSALSGRRPACQC